MEGRESQKQQEEEVEEKRQQKLKEKERRRQQQSQVANVQENRKEKHGKPAIDTSVFDHLIWEVECTAKVWKLLVGKQVPHDIKEIAIGKIQTLASGDWPRKLCKPLVGLPQKYDIKLYEAKLTKGGRMLWELAVTFSPRLSDRTASGEERYSEVIRIWDIVLDHSNVSHAIEVITQKLKRGKGCRIRKNLIGITKRKAAEAATGNKVRHPTLFRECQGSTSNHEMQWFPPASDQHIMKFYSFTSNVVNAALNDSQVEVEFPFRVTELEHAIINLQPEPPSSILLLGRSGTGKTICCLYRMWTKFVKYWQKTIEGPWIPRDSAFIHPDRGEDDTETYVSSKCDHLHQIFLTKNIELCREVRRNFCNMVRGCQFAKEALAQLDRPIPHRLQDVHQAQFPLFLTSRQFLLLLDASLPNPFFPEGVDGSPLEELGGQRTDRKGLAERTRFDERSEVTYEVFANELWPRINKKKLKCHPSLVWMEITSSIKGSFEALHSETGFLSLEEYVDFGKKMAPNFSTDREEIYNIFKMYKQELLQKNLFDGGDLVFHVYRRLREVRTPDWAIHEFYVDETQDFTQAELSLLIESAQDPNSLFLTGDTAQSITRGVAFRFKDLKSLFHYANKSAEAQGKPAVTVPKTVHQLTRNYRSHSGILDLAATVVDLLESFFPLSFDHLEPDQGLFDGPLPVIIHSGDVKDLPSLLVGNNEDSCDIEFGADQVILVRNDSEKSLAVFDKCRVMTINEAKGLEFNDVLLFNFFKNSPAAEKEWRAVIGFQPRNRSNQQGGRLEEYNLDQLSTTNRAHRDELKILNSELKFLYTAITRARNRLWIFEEEYLTKALPMLDLLLSNSLVAERKPTFGDDSSQMVKSGRPKHKTHVRKDCFEAAATRDRFATHHVEKKQQDLHRIGWIRGKHQAVTERILETARSLQKYCPGIYVVAKKRVTVGICEVDMLCSSAQFEAAEKVLREQMELLTMLEGVTLDRANVDGTIRGVIGCGIIYSIICVILVLAASYIGGMYPIYIACIPLLLMIMLHVCGCA